MIEVHIPPIEKLFNDKFVESFHNKGRYLIEWGGRGSSKSIFAAKKTLLRCITEKYFRCILYRRIHDTIRDSQYQTLKDVAFDMGIYELFTFTTNPMAIKCVNGNMFIARGGDQTYKIKSIKDPSSVWYEEDIPNEEDFYNITGSVRTTKSEYLQEIFTLNPEVDGHYEDSWFWQRFFKGHYPQELSFDDKTTVELELRGEIVEIDLKYKCNHSTYHDNRYLPDEYKALLESYKATNPYKFQVHTLGLWAAREVGNRFFKSFDISKHVKSIQIDIDAPLHISFDENVRPYPALTIWQLRNKKARQVHEICLRTPRNKLKEVANEFLYWCRKNKWNNLVFIYGDASSDKEDAKMEKGHNYFSLLRKQIEQDFKCRIRKPSKNPPVALSAEFINACYDYNFDDIEIEINEPCRESINDYMYAEEAQDGTMKKTKKDGIELLGHCSDTKRYFLTEVFKSSFSKYKDGSKPINYRKFSTTSNKSF